MSNHGRLLKKKSRFRGRPSTTGFNGVDFHKQSGYFRARIVVNRLRYELGKFETAEEANLAVLKAKQWLSENPHELFATEYEV
jgi:hypothetical protein